MTIYYKMLVTSDQDLKRVSKAWKIDTKNQKPKARPNQRCTGVVVLVGLRETSYTSLQVLSTIYLS